MKYSKNNKINLKWFVLIVFVIAVIFSISTAKAEINNNISALNQQLIASLKQLIVLLMQQVEELQKQLIVQQQVIESPKISTPYFIAEISSDRDAVRNNGYDRATLTIKTKLSNGQVISNKEVDINGQVYISNNEGIIIYLTQPTKTTPGYCGNDGSNIAIIITADGKVIYTKSIGIINIQPEVSSGRVTPPGVPLVCP